MGGVHVVAGAALVVVCAADGAPYADDGFTVPFPGRLIMSLARVCIERGVSLGAHSILVYQKTAVWVGTGNHSEYPPWLCKRD